MKSFVLGEFKTPESIVTAAGKLHAAGRKGLDTYSPFPLHGIDEALELKRSPVPLFALVGGITGASSGYLMQWWMNAVNYRINVGNRPYHSWPQNIPITFESGILIGVLAIFFGSMALFGLPRPYHAVFESEQFRSASLDAFWISVETDKSDDVAGIEEQLRKVGARRVHTVREGV